MRTSVGAITISDIRDGIHPLSLVLSNQSHTFAADNLGTVVSAEKTKFSCVPFVYVGDARATYDATLSVNNTYKITVTDSAGWVSTLTETLGQLVITAATVPGGVINKTGTFELSITVKNSIGNTTIIETVISLAKAIEGTGGAIVSLVPSRQTFRFDEAGASTDGDITIPVSSFGNVGSLSATYALNGSTSYSALTQGTIANKAKALDVDGAGGNDQIIISKENFGTADVFTVKVTGATGGVDTISIVKIQKGDTGAAALLVSITSSNAGFAFKNNSGAAKTLTAEVHDMADGSKLTAGITYQWKKNGTNVGTNINTFVVTASDIADGGSEQYSCDVSVA